MSLTIGLPCPWKQVLTSAPKRLVNGQHATKDKIVTSTFGDTARRLMADRAVSVRELSRLTFYDKAHLSRVLNGHKPPSAELAARLDAELDADGALIAAAITTTGTAPVDLRSGQWTHRDATELSAMLASATVDATNAVRLAHQWLITDPPHLVDIRAGRRIGGHLAAQLEQRVIQLRRLDDHLGGGDLAALVETELADTIRLLAEASYTDDIGRRLLVVVGELAQLAGWTLSDAGAHQAAARAYLTGVHAAHAAGDTPLAANLLSSLSYQVANVGKPADAVLLARSAERGARQTATPRTQALLADRVAWTHAKAGDSDATERALDMADEALGNAAGAEDPDWVYWVSRDELDVMAGRCFAELRRPLKAEPLLSAVLTRYDASFARERALYLTWLADTYVWAGEVDQAVATATEALELADTVNSARARDRVGVVAGHLNGIRSGAVRAFTDRFDAPK
jgi:tetratricopeptide (TPR) repeat protein